jgi:hypothetical protein
LETEQEAKLLASDGAEWHSFGSWVALEGDTALIGATGDSDNGEQSGSAYVFQRANGVWTEQAKLLPADGAAWEVFGSAIALDGDTAVIGARHDDDNGEWSGSAYVFTRVGGVWTQQAKLLPADGETDERFGKRLALDGDTLIVGVDRDGDNGDMSGSAYVFTRTGGVWTQQTKLYPADAADNQHFGEDVALDGDTALIAALGDRDNGDWSGAVYVFTRAAGVWTEQAKLLAADGAEDDYFGESVALDGDTALIGAAWTDDHGLNSGSAYVFTRMAGMWTEQAKLLASDAAAGDKFGKGQVALDGDMALIGALYDDAQGSDSGSAYVFTRTAGVWSEQAKLLASDGTENQFFGMRMAVHGDTALVAATRDAQQGDFAGAVYVFRLYDDQVPATGVTGSGALMVVLLGVGAYFLRRREGR